MDTWLVAGAGWHSWGGPPAGGSGRSSRAPSAPTEALLPTLDGIFRLHGLKNTATYLFYMNSFHESRYLIKFEKKNWANRLWRETNEKSYFSTFQKKSGWNCTLPLTILFSSFLNYTAEISASWQPSQPGLAAAAPGRRWEAAGWPPLRPCCCTQRRRTGCYKSRSWSTQGSAGRSGPGAKQGGQLTPRTK